MPDRSQHQEPQWLSLGQAARRLGVHPSTLRRWAHNGEVPVLVTPGRHRRFAVKDLERFAAHRSHQGGHHLQKAWAQTAMAEVRKGIARQANQRWLVAFRGTDRDQGRELGRRLMTVAMHFIADPEPSDQLLEEARAIGCRQAEAALRHGLTLSESIQATLFYRETLFEVAVDLPEVTRHNPEASIQILRRLNAFLSAVQLAITETYEHRLQPAAT